MYYFKIFNPLENLGFYEQIKVDISITNTPLRIMIQKLINSYKPQTKLFSILNYLNRNWFEVNMIFNYVEKLLIKIIINAKKELLVIKLSLN